MSARGGVWDITGSAGYSAAAVETAVPTPSSGDRDVERRPVAPAVTAVVVAHEPGPWFEETLASFHAQDYPRLSLVVLDTAADPGLATRVRAVVPDARVHPVDARNGFGPAANELLDLDLNSPFLLICHDDIALRADAVRLLVEEAVRSNAGVAGPKLVDWDEPERLRQVGIDVDKMGATLPVAEPGELDQEQHDAVRDLFAVPGACTLVRTDLFRALGGFDPAMTFRGEDVDLGWRAHLAGARVLVVPSAVVRHRESLAERRPDLQQLRLQRRHELRAMLSNYGPAHLLRVVPQALILTLLDAVYSLFTARLDRLRAGLSAWPWNLARTGSILRKRRRNRALRQLPDRDVRTHQVGGFAPVTHFIRQRADSTTSGRGEALMAALRSGSTQATIGTWVAAIVVLVLGSRHLISDGIPAIGELADLPDRGRDVLGRWWSGWQPTGLGRAGAAPTGLWLLGLLSWPFGGATGLLRTLLVLGLIPLGALGSYRLVAPFGSRRAQVVSVIAYLAAPIPYNAIANGSLTALIVYGSAPWILGGVARAWRQTPFGPLDGSSGPGVLPPSPAREVLALGLLLGIVAAMAPVALAVVVLIVVTAVVGSALCGMVVGARRAIAVATGAIVVAFALNLPWSLDLVRGDPDLVLGVRSSNGGELSLVDLLRLDTGPIGGGTLGWALPIAAVLPLVLGTGGRFAWAIRGWSLYLGSVALAWVGEAGLLPVGLPRPEVLLAPAAAGLALAVAMGMAAFEVDLRRYRFGWRQAVPVTAAVALAAAVVPILGSTFDGRWEAAERDFATTLRFIQDEAVEDDAFRVLWLGDPDTLPAGAWELADGVGFALTTDGLGTLLDRWPGPREEPAELIVDAIEIALDRGTSRLGRLLAPFGVRYLVLPERIAPAPFGTLESAAPAGLLAVLSEQLDLERVELSPGLVVYHNSSWAPLAAQVEQGLVGGASSFDDAARIDLTGATMPLTGERLDELRGPLSASTELYLSTPSDEGWRLDLGGSRALRSEAFGWANLFAVPDAGEAVLRFETSSSQRLGRIGQAVLWGLVVVVLLRLVAVDRAASEALRSEELA